MSLVKVAKQVIEVLKQNRKNNGYDLQPSGRAVPLAGKLEMIQSLPRWPPQLYLVA